MKRATIQAKSRRVEKRSTIHTWKRNRDKQRWELTAGKHEARVYKFADDTIGFGWIVQRSPNMIVVARGECTRLRDARRLAGAIVAACEGGTVV